MSAVFAVDRVALERAMEYLGLELPVRVRRCKLKAFGQYGFIKDGTHRIVVRRDLSADQASRTLWHELTHAQQMERNGNDAHAFDRAYRDGLPPEPRRDFKSTAWYDWFYACPYEQEAERAEENDQWLRLAVDA